MKIDKANPKHWLCLMLFGVNAVGALLLRRFRCWRKEKGQVILYGHRLNGNLLAIHRHWLMHAREDFDMVFLTMDKAYYRQLRSLGVEAALATRLDVIRLMARADAVISDHGLHVLCVLVGSPGLKFFDVWHGIPFKGFDAADFRLQHRYDEAWVASDLCRKLYVERFGFDPACVYSTGYARTDRLITTTDDGIALRASLGISPGRKTILFAPTWAQDDRGRSIFPFGCSEEEFIGTLSEFADAHQATILLRSHLNTGAGSKSMHSNVIALPASLFPDTEAILQASDVLVCDWSSIAFDFLLLDRPTVFLEVPPPFRKSFSLGPQYRFGAIVRDLGQLIQELEICLLNTNAYWYIHAEMHRKIRRDVYGDRADGHSTARCMEQLRACLAERRI